MKRFHSLPQAHLGIAFSFGIPMAYAAILNTVPTEAWLLFFINVTWVLIYDTQYAMSDREDDKKIAVKSSALLLDSLMGKRDYWAILCLQALMLIGLVVLGKLHHFGAIWYVSICVVGLFFIKHVFWINRQRRGYDSRNCFRAFLDNNYIGLILSIGLLVSLLP
jgi:4-hydroxybenzoate polyprenyltransferase